MSVAENDVAPSRASGNTTLRLHFTITAKFGSSPPCYCDCCLPKQFVLQNDVTWECPGESPKVELPPTAPALPSEDCAFLIEVLGKLAPGERRWINLPDDRNGKKAKELWGDPKKYKIHGPYCYGEPPVYPPNYSGAKEDALGEAYSDCEAWWRDSPAFTIDPSNRRGCKFM